MIVINVIEEDLQDLILNHLELNYNNLRWAGTYLLSNISLKLRLEELGIFSLFIDRYNYLYYGILLYNYSSKAFEGLVEKDNVRKIISIDRKTFKFINDLYNS